MRLYRKVKRPAKELDVDAEALMRSMYTANIQQHDDHLLSAGQYSTADGGKIVEF